MHCYSIVVIDYYGIHEFSNYFVTLYNSIMYYTWHFKEDPEVPPSVLIPVRVGDFAC